MAEKHDISTVEHAGSDSDVATPAPVNQHGFVTDLDNIPKGYYYSSSFLGTMFATGIGLAAATGAFGLAAPYVPSQASPHSKQVSNHNFQNPRRHQQ